MIESGKFKQWMKKLKDERSKARVVARINRLMEGLSGDVASIGGGLSELRIHYGPGYRVYYYQHGDTLVILLCGGDKSTQKQDIKMAHKILKEWREQRG